MAARRFKVSPTKDKKRLAARAAEWGGRIEKRALRARLDGVDVTLRLHAPKYAYGQLSVPVSETVGRFRAVRRRAVDRWLEPLVPSRRVAGNERAFDDAVLVETRDVDLLRALLADRSVREDLRRLVEAGEGHLRLHKDRLEWFFKRTALDEELSRAEVAAWTARLARVAAAAEEVARRHQFTPAPGFDGAAIGTVAAGVLAHMALVGTLPIATVRFPLVEDTALLPLAAALGLPLAAVAVVLFGWLVSRRSAAHRLMLLVLFLFGPGVPGAVYGGLHLANGGLDEGALVLDRFPVERVLHITEDDDGETVHHHIVHAAGAGPLAGDRVYRVPVEDWTRVETGRSELMVVTSPGRFGAPWIAAHRLDPATLAAQPLRGDGRH